MIWWAVTLFFLGVVLIWLEFILPGLILGMLGVAAIVGSTAAAIYAYPEYTVFIVVVEGVGSVVIISLGLYVMAKTKVLGGLVHQSDQKLEEGYSNIAQTSIRPGMRGKVITQLRPSGTIVMGDERIDAVANGAFIEAGTEVEVIEVHGNRVVVEPVQESEVRAGLGAT